VLASSSQISAVVQGKGKAVARHVGQAHHLDSPPPKAAVLTLDNSCRLSASNSFTPPGL
jgi:hypothetical protein